jgi:hypothetical protein
MGTDFRKFRKVGQFHHAQFAIARYSFAAQPTVIASEIFHLSVVLIFYYEPFVHFRVNEIRITYPFKEKNN